MIIFPEKYIFSSLLKTCMCRIKLLTNYMLKLNNNGVHI